MRFSIVSSRFHPLRAIEWVFVGASMIQGLYIFSPLYQYSLAVNGATPFAAALAHPAGIFIWVTFIVITGLMLGWGLWKNKPKFRATALFGQVLLRFYNVLTTIIVAGFLPITWIYAAILVVICVILWVAERGEVNRASS